MNILLLFIKNPRLGYVKTRLAATVGNEKALQIYHTLLEKTREAALGSAAEKWLWYSDEIPENDDWSANLFNKKLQPGGDLGNRMSGAFNAAFEAGAQKVVIIGSDCPEVTGELLEEAFDQLASNDVVIGPTFDGGYYLLGMSQYFPGLFENVAWSTESVFPATMEKCTDAGLRVGQLKQLSDIDNESDWQEYLQRK